ncbi:uncharacterized protein TM_0508-like [Sycon ciliatum]|uniref:uncharacterized protein TM_0508-like n=1 Tax=Sycon ciliatum TaxID=27933 RepID=UPI0020AD5052|eukprot:scpid96269/ scgid20644/ Uncharacterized protein TM_0508
MAENGDNSSSCMAGAEAVRPGFAVHFSKGDIIGEEVDALVISVLANSHQLKGNLALGVVRAAGNDVYDCIDRHLSQQWILPNAVEHFPAGHRLPHAKHLLLVGLLKDMAFSLQDAVYHALVRANDLRCTSVALPAIGCGGFGYSVRQSADSIVDAIQVFQSTFGQTMTIRKVHLCAVTSETQRNFRRALKASDLTVV